MNAEELRGIEFLFQGIQVLAHQMAAAQAVQFGVVSCPSKSIRCLPETQVECATRLRLLLETCELLIC
jgi:hypothetical protein